MTEATWTDDGTPDGFTQVVTEPDEMPCDPFDSNDDEGRRFLALKIAAETYGDKGTRNHKEVIEAARAFELYLSGRVEYKGGDNV